VRLVWSPASEIDLLQIWSYLEQEASENKGGEQVDQIRLASKRILEWPNSGRARDELVLGMRSIVVRPYVIFYRAAANEVQIVRVLHGRRDIETIFADPL
jgi:toxin ParE1/3/4